MSVQNLHLWSDKGSKFHWKGHKIFELSQGHGPNLVLIHGFPTSSLDWSLVWPFLIPHFRVYALDMLGFGLSSKPNQPYTISQQVDLIQDWLRARGVQECHILAHDYGDTVAQEWLARLNRGENAIAVDRVVFLNGGLFPESHKPLMIQKLLAGPLGPLLAMFLGKAKFEQSMAKVCARPWPKAFVDKSWEHLIANGGKSVTPKLLAYIKERETFRERWVQATIRHQDKIRLIDGTFDPISGKRVVERFKELCPKGDCISLEDIGHYPQLEAPKKVAGLTAEWLEM